MQRFWNTVLEPLLSALRPASLVEVGSWNGDNTRRLLRFCDRQGAKLHVVEPAPGYDVEELERQAGAALDHHTALSLHALGLIDRPDLVLIDGDHNWYTVFHELQLLEERARQGGWPFPVVVLHDVGWPYGRRDLYYAPDAIPDAFRHPYNQLGLEPGEPGLVEHGGMNRSFHNALVEGEPRSGVLTAVEDFLSQTRLDLETFTIPGLHGLALIYPAELPPSNDDFRAFLEAWRLERGVVGHIELLEAERLAALVDGSRHRADAAALTAAVERLERRAEGAREQAEAGAQGAERLRAELGRRSSALEATRQRLEQVKGSFEERLERRKAEISGLETRLERRRLELEGSRKQLEASRRELEANRQKLEASRREVEASRQRAEAGRLQIEVSREEVAAGVRRLEESRREIDARQEELLANQRELEQLRSRVHLAHEYKARLDRQIDRVRTALKRRTLEARQLRQRLVGAKRQQAKIKRRLEEVSAARKANAEAVAKYRPLAESRKKVIERQKLWVRVLEQDRLWHRQRRQAEELRQQTLKVAGWLEALSEALEEILGSWRWRLGHLLVHDIVKRFRRTPNRGGRWAPDHARPVARRFVAWQRHTGRKLHMRSREERDDLALPLHEAPSRELAEAADEQRRRCDELGEYVKHRETELKRLAQWLEQLLADTEAIVASWRWRVGDLIFGGALRFGREGPAAVRTLRAIAAEFGDWSRQARNEDLGDRQRDMRLVTDVERRRLTEELLVEPQDELVSVIIPTWNRASVIGQAIASVRQQSYRNWEVLIIDDGSTDDTREVVAKLAGEDPAIRFLQAEHQGVSAARNVGLEAARGAVIAYLDSDNEWDPDYLLFMVSALRSSGRSSAYSAQRIVQSGGKAGARIRARAFHLKSLLRNNYIDLNAFVHRADVLDRVGAFDTELKRWVDWDLILRIVRDEAPAQVPVVLGTYHIADSLDQITSKQPIAYKLMVLAKHLIDWPELAGAVDDRRPRHATIVIPVHNQSRLTRECLESLFSTRAGFDFDVVVVDNASTDSTAGVLAELEERYEGLRHIEAYENYGFGLGCNLGLAASTGEYVVYLNNDTTVTPGWLGTLVEPLVEQDEIGATGPKLLYPDGSLQSGGMVFNDRSAIPYNLYQAWDGDHPAVNKRRTFQTLTGACLALRARDLIELRGFDCVYLNGCEDIDLCLRLSRRLGKRILYTPESVVVHYESRTAGRGRHIRYNREVFEQRWGATLEADDRTYFEQDGYEVASYEKPGAEPDGPTAVYYPELRGGADAVGAPPRPAVTAERRPRVGFVSIWYERGVSFVTHQLAAALEYGGFETHVYARWESDKFRNAEPVFHPRVQNAGDDPPPDDIVDWARERSLDLVLFVEVHPRDWARVEALQSAGIRVMGYEHLDILRREALPRYGTLDAFLFSSFFSARSLQERFPAVPGLLVPWGIPAESIRRSPETDDSRVGPVRFVHVAGWGGLNQRKNSSLVVRAFAAADLEGAELHFFSQAPLDDYGRDCRRILESNAQIRVRQGTMPDIFRAYDGKDVLLAPSKREGLGLPLLEALASGLAVITSDGYLMKQWLIDGEHGIVCPARPVLGKIFLPEVEVDERGVTDAIRRLGSDPEEVTRLRANVARDRDAWLWSWQRQLFSEQLRQMIDDPSYRPATDFSYLPEAIRAFERRRVASVASTRTATVAGL